MGRFAAFTKDPSIERSLRRLEGRLDIERASNIVSFLIRRGTDLQTLRSLVEAIADLKTRRQVVRGLNVLKRAVMKDRQAAILLPGLFLRNPQLLKSKTDSLIIFGRMYPFLSDSRIIDSLNTEEMEILAAAYKKTLTLFPRPEIQDLFFTVLNDKTEQAENLAQKLWIASTWAENLVSILNRFDRRWSK
jgi:hypothetical protein